MAGYRLLYLNSHFRFSKYMPGGFFPIHMDGTNYDNDRPEMTGEHSAVSVCTLNIFINDNFEGGETEFFYTKHEDGIELPGPRRIVVEPVAGRASLFYAKQYHQGCTVKSSHKYLLRTDVMGVPI